MLSVTLNLAQELTQDQAADFLSKIKFLEVTVGQMIPLHYMRQPFEFVYNIRKQHLSPTMLSQDPTMPSLRRFTALLVSSIICLPSTLLIAKTSA